MESDAERGFGSTENDGEELSPVLTIMSLNRGMDSIVAKAGTLSTLEKVCPLPCWQGKGGCLWALWCKYVIWCVILLLRWGRPRVPRLGARFPSANQN